MRTTLPDGADVFDCEIAGCEWDYLEPAVDVDDLALASVFGIGTMARQAMNERMQRIERKLREHYSTHKIEDFLREIARLKQEIFVRDAPSASTGDTQ